MVEYHPICGKNLSRLHQFGPKVLQSKFLGCTMHAGVIWKGDILVADIEELEEMDAFEIYAKRLNAKDVFTQKGENLIFPIADGKVTVWRRSGSENNHLNPGSPRPRRRTRQSSMRIRRIFCKYNTSWYRNSRTNDYDKWLRKSVYDDKHILNNGETIVDNYVNDATHVDARKMQTWAHLHAVFSCVAWLVHILFHLAQAVLTCLPYSSHPWTCAAFLECFLFITLYLLPFLFFLLFLMTDGDSVTINNLRDSANGTFVTLDDNLPLTGYEPNAMEFTDNTELSDAVFSDINFQDSLVHIAPSSDHYMDDDTLGKLLEITPITAVRKV